MIFLYSVVSSGYVFSRHSTALLSSSVYFNLLPFKFRFYKWIKGKKEKENKDKIEYLATHFECSKKEAKDYLSLLDKKTINNIIKNYKQ